MSLLARENAEKGNYVENQHTCYNTALCRLTWFRSGCRKRTLGQGHFPRDRNCSGHKKSYKISDKEGWRVLKKALGSSKIFLWALIERAIGVSFWRELWKSMLNALNFYICFD